MTPRGASARLGGTGWSGSAIATLSEIEIDDKKKSGESRTRKASCRWVLYRARDQDLLDLSSRVSFYNGTAS